MILIILVHCSLVRPVYQFLSASTLFSTLPCIATAFARIVPPPRPRPNPLPPPRPPWRDLSPHQGGYPMTWKQVSVVCPYFLQAVQKILLLSLLFSSSHHGLNSFYYLHFGVCLVHVWQWLHPDNRASHRSVDRFIQTQKELMNLILFPLLLNFHIQVVNTPSTLARQHHLIIH